MGLSIVQQVINQLISNGIPAIRGYPARKAPALPEVQAAVSLKGTERDGGSVEVLVSVCGPTSFGGGVCEDTAQKACRVLRGMGAQCSQEPCRQLERMDVFYVDVTAEFFGCETEDGWMNFAVSVGDAVLSNVRSFKAWQSGTEEEGLQGAAWRFQIEEDLLPDAPEGAAVAEPFTMMVSRGLYAERYLGCKLTEMQCELTSGRLHRIRQGIATGRTLHG